MSEQDLLDPNVTNTGGGGNNGTLPNAVAVLVLGIISIVTCWLYAVPGLVCGIIAISLHQKDKAIHQTNPQLYGDSFKMSNAGFICGIIGLGLSAIYLIFVVLFLAGITSAGRF